MTGPNGEKRPDCTVANAIRVARISVGDLAEEYEEDQDPPRPDLRGYQFSADPIHGDKSQGTNGSGGMRTLKT